MRVIVVIASSTRGTTPRDGTPPVINPCPSTQDQDEKASMRPLQDTAISYSSTLTLSTSAQRYGSGARHRRNGYHTLPKMLPSLKQTNNAQSNNAPQLNSDESHSSGIAFGIGVLTLNA